MSGMTVVYVFQATGAVATSLSVAVALWVILWRDPRRERQRLIERDEERADAREAQLRTWREEAGAVQPQAIRISPDLTGGIHQWHCGYTNRSRTVISDATAIVTAIDQENPDRDVNYSVLDLKAHSELAESIGSGGRISPELAVIRQAQLAQTAVENFSSTLAPGGSSVMTYTVAEQPTGNTGVQFTVTVTWSDVSGNRWSRTNTTPPELLTQGV